MTKKLIIFGAGQIAELAHYYFTHDSAYDVVAFCIDEDYKTQETFCSLPIVSFEEVQKHYPPQEYECFIALAYAHLNGVREEKYKQAKIKGYKMASYVSSKATILNDDIGDNAFILEDNTVQPFVKISNNVTLWSGNHIGHHSEIEDNVFISSHVVVSGNCKIGHNSFVGVNATLRDGISIGAQNIIGMGTTIGKSTQDESIYKTTPMLPAKLKSTQLKKI